MAITVRGCCDPDGNGDFDDGQEEAIPSDRATDLNATHRMSLNVVAIKINFINYLLRILVWSWTPLEGPKSFPLDGAPEAGPHVVDHAVDVLDLVDEQTSRRKDRHCL
jgi:hypothetical protein